mgnify:CR=1 FL=1
MWRELDSELRRQYEGRAALDKERYKRELDLFLTAEQEYLEATRIALEASVPEDTKKRYFGSEGRL